MADSVDGDGHLYGTRPEPPRFDELIRRTALQQRLAVRSARTDPAMARLSMSAGVFQAGLVAAFAVVVETLR